MGIDGGVLRDFPVVSSLDELSDIVDEIRSVGAFAFDTETRGVISRHPDVQAMFDTAWAQHQSSLKVTNENIITRSREALEAKYQQMLALDPLRNEVFWIALATHGRSWAIPMGHRYGVVLTPGEEGDGSTVPPPGYRKMLKNGTESLAKAKYSVPPVFAEPPVQLNRSDVFAALKPLFFDDEIIKIGHNVKFDARSIRKYYGDIPPGPYIDTMVLQFVLNENLREYSLTNLISTNFDGLSPYAKEGKVGAIIDHVPFDVATRYVHLDARWTWMLYRNLQRKLKGKHGLINSVQLDMDVLHALMYMEDAGIAVDTRQMQRLGKELDARKQDLLLSISDHAFLGFNPDSVAHKKKLLFDKKRQGGLGLKPVGKTKSGNHSVDEATMEALRNEHPVVPMLLEWAEVTKLKSTYIDGLMPRLVKGRLHPSFNLHRVQTGRLSACVSGDTLLHTNRGVFRFDQYFPRVGDLVPTHTGQWKPVVRKIYKGEQPMVSVRLSNGSMLKCTEEHRILTPAGWVAVGNLAVGEEVYSHVGVKEVYGEPTEHSSSLGSVPGRRDQTDHRFDSGVFGHDVSERTAHREGARPPSNIEAGASVALLSVEAGREESDAGQVWRTASQLHWAGGGWPRVPDAEGQWEVCIRASAGYGRGSWFERVARWFRRTPHQRGQEGQSSGQLGVGDYLGASVAACEVVTIAEIVPVGVMGVWDIEVEGDHSYVTHGFVNHNSNPNLQNIPRGSDLRGLFVAGPGEKMLVADYDQIELRVMCMFSKDPKMSRFFLEGIDIHAGAASLILGKPIDQVDKEERQVGKMVNFLTGFGGGAYNLSQKTGISEEEAQSFIDNYYRQFSKLAAWKEEVKAKARKLGYVETMGGRRRRLPDINSSDNKLRARAERQAVNAVVQGTAADICKEAMVRVTAAFRDTPARLLVQVHDELVCTAPEDAADDYLSTLILAMGDGTVIEGIPLLVSAHAGYSWAEAKG